jgi:hypothetical protein
MEPLRLIISSIIAIGLTFSVSAAAYDVSVWSDSGEQRRPLSVTTNDVIVIKSPAGAVAIIQFSSFDSKTASYRWRYRAAKSQPVQSGKGQLRESYNRKPHPEGGYIVTPKPDHDTTIRAGDLHITWSYGSSTNGYLYYNTNRATIQIMASDAFDKDF